MAIGRHILILAILALVLAPMATADACSSCGCRAGHDHEEKKAEAGPNIVETAVKAGSFKTLVAAVKAAGLVETLSGKGPFTVFAPTDAAFAKLPEGTVEALLKDKAALKSILTYHVVPGRVSAEKVVASTWLETAQGQSLLVRSSGDGVTIDGASVVKTDIETSNGIIHVIDTVVLPRKDIVKTAKEAKVFHTLLAAAKAAGLADALAGKGPFTVFAPTDEAFAKLPEGTVEALLKDTGKLKAILTYHVVPGRVLSSDLKVGSTQAKTLNGKSVTISRSAGGSVKVDTAAVAKADIVAGNGVIHVIDSVILPR